MDAILRPRARPRRRRLAAWAGGILLASAVAGGAPAGGAGAVRVVDLDGVIGPASARYFGRELRLATAADAGAVVVRLDTPGGLERSMRDMTAAILDARVPVVVYVAPSGARAASAGTFLALAAHVAAMAPGTTIGAAHPVALGGGQTDPTVADKAAADAAAYARALADLRGRNAAWAERAVLESASATAEEALRAGVVDLVARDLAHLIAALDGREVTTAAGRVRLRTVGVPVVERDMGLVERGLQAVTDPNVAYVLFLIGVVGILAELYAPGSLVPGAVGIVALLLAFVGFGSLPVSAVGIALLLLGIGLVAADLAAGGVGALGAAGAVAFVIGSAVLYQPVTARDPGLPALRVDPWLIAGAAAALMALIGVGLRAVVRLRHQPIAVGVEALVGREGVAVRRLDPIGPVLVDGEMWTATAVGGPIPAGARVTVDEVRGVTLRVHPGPDEPPEPPA